MDTITGVRMAAKMGELGGMGILPRFESIESQAKKVEQVAKFKVIAAAAVGCNPGFFERAKSLVAAGASVINIDVAHGHMKKNIEATKKLKNYFGNNITLISGIASTYECADDLFKAGADAVLVGVGAGSICTTRIQTGSGSPGFYSLVEAAKAARKHNKVVIPDAGIRTSGDIVKALAAGASAIVAGSLFAGTDETPGDIIKIEGKKYKRYNGSASESEKEKQVKKDPNGKNLMYTKHIEGVEAFKPYNGTVEELIIRLCAGIRSGLSYSGAFTIEELWKKAKFIRVTNAGVVESNAHDVLVNRNS